MKKIQNKKTIFFACVFVLILAAIVIAQTSRVSLKGIEKCKTIEWETEDPIYGTCREGYITTICDDPPINKSCHEETAYYDYRCQTGTETIQHSKEECDIESLEITKEVEGIVTEKGRINFKEWGKCSNKKEDSELIIICDSKYDGNNDGICQSGESCIKFVVTQNDVKRYLKNSQEDFTEEDKSFFLEKLSYEVMAK